MKEKLRNLLLTVLSVLLLTAEGMGWGWGAHRYINEHAVDYLPPEMSFFQNQREFLHDHAVDPDQSKNRPGYWHYIDIDNYPEFFNGTLSTDLNKLADRYTWHTVTSNGIVPWAITTEIDSMGTLMASGNWDMAWQAAADLGHYVADSHQPLHLTRNYNGKMTGNDGIHSRYETKMLNGRLGDLRLPSGKAMYWDSVIDTVFQTIHTVYPYNDMILTADNAASSQDPDYDSTYYDLMWDALDSVTIDAINRSILDLASVWYTTWINAGSPYPPGVFEKSEAEDTHLGLERKSHLFSKPTLNIHYTLPEIIQVRLAIFDTRGRLVRQLASGSEVAGQHEVSWKYTDDEGKPIPTGVYFARLSAGKISQAAKIVYSP